MRRGTPKEFKVKYDLLTASEQEILEILALTQETVGVIAFYDILEKCGVHRLNNKPLNIEGLLRMMEKMVPRNFVTFVKTKSFQIKASFQREFINKVAGDVRLKKYILAIQGVLPIKENGEARLRSYDACLREMQFALLTKDSRKYEAFKNIARKYFRADLNKNSPEDFFFFNPINKPLLIRIPVDFQHILLQEGLYTAINKLQPIDDILLYLNALITADSTKGRFKSLQADGTILQGKLEKAKAFSTSFARQGWIAFLQGDTDKAIALYEKELTLLNKASRKKVYMEHLAAPFYLIALLKTNKPQHYTTVLIHAQIDSRNNAFQYIRSVVQYLRGNIEGAKSFFKATPKTSIDWLFKGLVACWTGQGLTKEELLGLKKQFTAARKNGFKWLEMEYAFIFSKLEENTIAKNQYTAIAKELESQLGVQSMISAIRTMEKWERVLRSLGAISNKSSEPVEQTKKAEEVYRLVWLIDREDYLIQGKEQKRNKKGGWSKGKTASYDKLKEGKVKGLTEKDKPLIAAIIEKYDRKYTRISNTSFDYEGLAEFLVGHPLIFRQDNANIPVEITAIQPELLVEEKPGRFEIKFSHPIGKIDNPLIQETPTRFNYIAINPIHLEVAKALEGEQAISIPIAAKSMLSGVLKSMKDLVPVQSSLAHSAEALPIQKGSTTIHVHLLPLGDGFKLELFSKPATTLPPYFKPGKGRKDFVAEIAEQPTLIERDLKAEVANSQQVENACPTLQEVDSHQGEWTFEETETCLNILLELEPLKEQGLVQLEWPKGEKLRLKRSVGFDQFSMQIKRDNDWFGVTGELRIDAQQVVDMQRLLDLVAGNDSQFIELSDGQFVALTKAFKKKLAEMNTFLTKTKKGNRVHGLAATAMEDFMSQVNELEVDAAWKKQVNRLKKAQKVRATVPSTFQAELRSYQLEGYQWLSQLAAWGVGACLADDMGLGKTVQGLAVLVDRANEGPALVVAPASVCRNWRKESLKFAPTLNPIIFGAGDRSQTIKDLKKYDLLITTYGLLQQEAELFASKKFNTIILDEAQAIKNRAAKRSKAAMKLQGDFKILTTGTPIENHLGELWNLFHFLNPGLLGSYKDFQERYALPIEKYNDKIARTSLKKLIQPFILRRRKNEVLEELPSKTEITLSVALSSAEKAFYEALRQRAVEQIETDLKSTGHVGMQILAQITRLRQACCHPKLVQADIDIESSKLRLFGETVEELIANGHKALVFSQFVGHLKIMAAFLQEKKISYQYLDGQTSMKKREEQIDAFQAGKSDLFLISLKAGGVGLNLTAADYVIHTDPWWNPAVEDQASDRAHRIGQKRPVTIYRLVTEHTIEEKIVALHHQKRDLADSLLEGTERSGRLSSEELLELIKEG